MPLVGRVYFASLKNGERYYLRLLICNVVGPTSFQHLQTVNGIEYTTYREAANLLGLLIGYHHYDASLREAAAWQTGNTLRHMLAIILKESPPADPRKLWEDHRENLSDDCLRRLQRRRPHLILTNEQLHNYALSVLATVLNQMDRSLEDVGMPEVNSLMLEDCGICLQDLDRPSQMAAECSAHRVRLVLEHANHEQADVFHSVANALAQENPEMFFLNGPGGTGKTFIVNGLLHHCNSLDINFLSVASSGIAALLLFQGQTAHTTFKIPLSVSSTSTCSFSADNHIDKKI